MRRIFQAKMEKNRQEHSHCLTEISMFSQEQLDGCQFLPCKMLFLEHVCCKVDVIDKTYKGHRNAESMVNIADHRHRVSTSSASKLFILQSPGQDNAKRGLDEPDILEVVICRKHMSYEILRALQLGIRDLSGRYMELPKKELLPLDFKSTQSTWIQYSKQNTKGLAPGAVSDFQWKDYCPAVFRYLLELGNINYADYMVSVCGPETLREISSPGKSGSLLFRSKDGRFVIKTLRKHEVKVLCKMLPNYLYHVKQYRTSLLIKLYGLHAVRPIGGWKVYFVVMENVLQLDVHMHRSYDLKGSSQG
ncbi:phosphatidylinositol 4-phosphate 5-kinase 9-like [Diospyros lotus]|uniref:phosphatidylinositol 4-phosphate 5-kinase 9-like n=1 Tax=Diospyros lotus TaxID=55363 RepID=UPI00225253ED|nr:phosphatidylinositol 4-phosphate 5-kinase 9-like [Diospyros lotus]XP_052194046.1 phosphatidylinositol 4-phosphate 5-kinase 9-like [Diospyros lotus]